MKRYNFPCILPAISLLFVVCARRGNLLPALRGRLLTAGAALLIAAVAVAVGMSTFTNEYKVTLQSLPVSLMDSHITPAAMREEYAAVQRALPPDSTVLTVLTAPFLLNFGGSQTILFGDLIGSASPHPGWPVRQSGDAFAAFLEANHIRYLAYGYGECPHTAGETCQQVYERVGVPDASKSQLVRSEFAAQHDAIAQFEELAQTRKHIYDDGTIWVIDLETRAARP